MLPDIFKLQIDHTGRHLEFVLTGQYVEQVALQTLTGNIVVFLLDLLAHGLDQLVHGFQAELGGKGIVQRLFFYGAYRLHGDLEERVLSGQVFRVVRLRKGHLDVNDIAGFGAFDLFLEAGDELALAQYQTMVFRLAALEFLAVDRTDEIDGHLVAGLGGMIRRGVFVTASLFCQLLDPFIDHVVADFSDQLFET